MEDNQEITPEQQKAEEILKNSDVFNPKKKFETLESAANFAEKEWSEENIMKEFKKFDMPITVFDPEYNHSRLFALLNKVPQRTPQEKLYIKVLKAVIAISTEAQRSKTNPTFMQIRTFISDFLNEDVQRIIEIERRALDYVRQFLCNKDLGKFGDKQ